MEGSEFLLHSCQMCIMWSTGTNHTWSHKDLTILRGPSAYKNNPQSRAVSPGRTAVMDSLVNILLPCL